MTASDRTFGPQCTVGFFEYADLTIDPVAKRAGVPDARATQFDHLALNLPDDEYALRDCGGGSFRPAAP